MNCRHCHKEFIYSQFTINHDGKCEDRFADCEGRNTDISNQKIEELIEVSDPM